MNHDDLSNGAPDAPTQAERTEDMLSMSMFSTRADYDAAARAQAEQLHDWPQQTGINSPFNACMYRDDCRSEHTQRLTLQHHAADQAQRIADLEAERDELRARLAEIEAQEPVAISKAGNLFWAGNPQDWRGVDCSLFARPVPAQAVPDADGARFRWLCEDHSDRETRERCRSLIDRLPVMSYSDAVMSIDAAMAAAPEHKA